MEGIRSMGFEKATPIQEQAIPLILQKHDLIACAQTGTGKTAAYVLPIIHNIVHAKHRHFNTLILAPTRELALQIDQQIEGFGYFVSVSSIAVYGGGDGMAWEQQHKAIHSGADIITATPGRLLSMLTTKEVNLNHLEHLILDEADRMLDMGFYDDIMRIISYLPKKRQTLLFSATMPPKIREMAHKILQSPKEITLAISKPAEGILQQAYLTYDAQKEKLLMDILSNEEYQSILIFASTKEKVKKLGADLKHSGFAVKAFHSDIEQAEREQIMRDFKGRRLRILVGTDVLSRGIDVEGINLVINYDAPPDPEDYVHRIGRTARADAKGTAITFINERDQEKFSRIEQLIGREVPKIPLPEKLGAGPLYQPGKKRPQGFQHRRNAGNSNRNRKPHSRR
jgi:ATP-dependent RNA helicase RhlE